MAVESRGVPADRLSVEAEPVQQGSATRLNHPHVRATLVLLPALCVLLFELYREVISPGAFHSLPGSFALTAVVCVGAIVSTRLLFALLERQQRSALWLSREIASLAAVPSSGGLSTDEVLAAFLDRLLRALPTKAAAVYLIDRDAGRLRRASSLGAIAPAMAYDVDLDSAGLYEVLRSGRAVYSTEYSWLGPRGRALPAALVPLRSRDVDFGLLILVGDWRGRLREHLDLLAVVGGQIAVVLDNHALFQESRELAEHREYLAVLQERDRLAREMHDSLAQVLGLVSLKARVIQGLLDAHDLPRAKSEIADVESVAEAAYADAREAIVGLRGAPKAGRRLAPSLEEYLRQFSRQSGLRADLEIVADAPTSFGPSAESQLIRVVQEALTNVRKHAGASRVVVRFDAEPGYARIVVEDDGKGFVPTQRAAGMAGGYGLQTMAERVEGLGGTLTIDSEPGRGTRVVVRVPVEAIELDATPEPTRLVVEAVRQAK